MPNHITPKSGSEIADLDWDAFVAAHPDGHLLQTSQWAALKCQFGWQVERVASTKDGHIVAGAQVLLRRLPWGQTLAYVPKGPLVDWRNPRLAQPLLELLRDGLAPTVLPC